MRAILIDPVQHTINEVEHDASDYHNINKAIRAELFTTINLLEPGDAVFIDDEGRINGRGEGLGGFRLLGDPDESLSVPLAGYGLVLGSDDKGDTAPAKTNLDWLRAHVEWLDGAWFEANPPPPMQYMPLEW